ncbi:hypothetical protein GSF08_03690 [Clostridiaceae bacterium DONG20-135]|uniref:Threonyl/alanyl tRNA synthetase SAD domain-containing protein n=1 Tax=Copranaerobaculum intestinale TaxID=2692629 RepID=A0A6N8UBC5_9FIRM|nr:DHHA1 domain-containing protein [Copranaerobaculum intestinale]MXQ73037.1 hypothetical protein [Copranaerobaculum intestinale]
MINRLIDDCFLSELTTVVEEVVPENGYFWHHLKETIFFVEKGGMTSDIGVINNHEVLALKEEGGKVWHLLDCKLEGPVRLSINLHERFRKCQVHTAQHLISALLSNVYKVHTLSHHVSDEENDIEFDFSTFTEKQLSELQILCNGLVRDDLPVTISYPSRAEASQYAPADRLNHEDLRVVRIGTLDYNLCGCMHVPSLRYIQLIKILRFEKTAKGYKIFYICGDQLLDCLQRRYEVLDEASSTLALSHLYINTGIHKLLNEVKNLTRDQVIWKQKYYVCKSKELCETTEPVIIYAFDDIDVKSLTQLAQYTIGHYEKAIVFIAKIFDESRIVIARNQNVEFDVKGLFNKLCDKFQLKGGGNDQMCCGGGKYEENIVNYVKSLIEA